MKKIIVLVILLMCICCHCAFADKLEGEWTGIGQALGNSVAVSTMFDGEGNFTASGLDMAVSGSYTLSGDEVTLSAQNMSMLFTFSSDGSTESLTGSMTYMGVSGSITLTRDVVSEIVTEQTPVSPVHDYQDIHALWTYSDKMTYALSLFESGYAKLSIADEQSTDESLKESLDRYYQEDNDLTVADLIKDATNHIAKRHDYAARFKIEGGIITLELLSNDFDSAPESFFTPMWKPEENSLVFAYAIAERTLEIYDGQGKTLKLTGGDYAKAENEEECFWRYSDIKKGDKGSNVKRLQSLLIEKGFLSDKADGVFGSKTENAVEKLQKESGMEVNGIADESVWDILLK